MNPLSSLGGGGTSLELQQTATSGARGASDSNSGFSSGDFNPVFGNGQTVTSQLPVIALVAVVGVVVWMVARRGKL